MYKDDLILLLVSALLAGAATAFLCEIAIRLNLNLDPVNHRSSHTVVASRLGGGAIIIALGLSLIWGGVWGIISYDFLTVTLLVGTILGMIIGLADDFLTLRVRVKIFSQVILALGISLTLGGVKLIPIPGAGIETGILAIPLGALWIVAFVNLFNFMDGVNGLAAGTALIALLVLSILISIAGHSDAIVLFVLLSASVAGFFSQNYGRGRIFLGDSGSHALGFMLGACALDLPQRKLLGTSIQSADPRAGMLLLAIGLLFLPHILDVFYTLITRLARRKNIFKAHREHLYQKLHQSGWSHRQVADLYITFTALGSVFVIIGIWGAEEFIWGGAIALGVGFILVMIRSVGILTYKSYRL